MSEVFRIGVGRERITPDIGTNLFGYPYDRFSTEIHDDLNATAFAIDNGDGVYLIFSLDICCLPICEIEKVTKVLHERFGINGENTVFSATHTHSGPCTRSSSGWGESDSVYIENILFPGIIAAAEKALSSMKEAVMGVGYTESEVGVNRRQITLDGEVILGQNPWGIFNKEMTVISFKEPGGDPIGIIVNYGCHGTSAGNGLEVTRDWSGVMVDMLEKELGCPAALLVGNLGDAGPKVPDGSTVGNIPYMEELGKTAGTDALRAYNTIKEYKSPVFKMIQNEITLPYEALAGYEETKAALEALGDLEKLRSVTLKKGLQYKRILEIYDKNLPIEKAFSFKQNVFCLDDIAFVTFPFEIFCAISMRIAYHSPFGKTLLLSNANGANGYFPAKGEILLGGYEVDMFKVFNGFSIIDDADTSAVIGSVQALERLKESVGQ